MSEDFELPCIVRLKNGKVATLSLVRAPEAVACMNSIQAMENLLDDLLPNRASR